MITVYKDIPGFEGKYQISIDGKIRELKELEIGQTDIVVLQGKKFNMSLLIKSAFTLKKPSHTKKEVNQYTKDGTFIKTWHSISEIGLYMGICHSSIRRACEGKLKTAGGFVWKFNN